MYSLLLLHFLLLLTPHQSPATPILENLSGLVSPSHPPHSFHESNLYKHPVLVEELSVDPTSWNWTEKGTPAWAIVLYAPWCGHCQHFKTTWEEFAARASGAMCSTSLRQFKLRFGAVNCVSHEKICDDHGLKTYPTLLLVWDDGIGARQSHEIKFKVDTVDAMLTHTTKQLGCQTFRTFSKSDVTLSPSAARETIDTSVVTTTTTRAQHLRAGDSAGDNAVANAGGFVRESATLMSRLEDALHAMKFSLLQLYSGRQMTMNQEDLNAAKDWIRALLTVSRRIFDVLDVRITPSLQELLKRLSLKDTKRTFRDMLTTTGLLEKNEDVTSLSEKGWKTCRDASGGGSGGSGGSSGGSSGSSSGSGDDTSRSHKRGFTCGLWTLFHLMASNIDTSMKGKDIVRGVVQFIQTFFQCEECRTHFMTEYGEKEYQRVTGSHDQSFTVDDAARWLWRAHNGVNRRLRLSEPKGSIWMRSYPSCDDCGSIDCCSRSSSSSSSDDSATGADSGESGTLSWSYNEPVALQYVQDVYCVDTEQPGFVCQRNVVSSMLAGSIVRPSSVDQHLLSPLTLSMLRSWWYVVLFAFVFVACAYSQKWQTMRREAYLMYWKTA